MEITKVLKDNNFSFNHKFGQNFITDNNFLESVVNDTGINRDDEVLEIGTGAGTLTRVISQNAKKVVTYEIDKKLTEVLNTTLQDLENVTLKMKDVMSVSLEEIESDFEDGYHMIANLPYYITTPIIFKFIESQKLKSLNIMVQKEVAERITAKPNSKDYGIITVMIDYFGDASISRIVKRNMFIPAPNVDSAIVSIKLNKKYDVEYDIFSRVVHGAFAMRRKTLVNNLEKAFKINKEELTKIIEPLKPTVRAEELSTQDFVNLANKLREYK